MLTASFNAMSPGGDVVFDVAFGELRHFSWPAVEVVVKPSLRSNATILDPVAASHFRFPVVDGTTVQELRAAVRPPFPKNSLSAVLQRSAVLRLPQQTDIGPVPEELSTARFRLRVDELFPGALAGYWSTPAATLYLQLELRSEQRGKPGSFDKNYGAVYSDSEGGWALEQSEEYWMHLDVFKFEAQVPVSVLHRSCTSSSQVREKPPHYQDHDGKLPYPSLVAGHRDKNSLENVGFDIASPQIISREHKEWPGWSEDGLNVCGFTQASDYLSEVEKHFAGTLWERARLGASLTPPTVVREPEHVAP